MVPGAVAEAVRTQAGPVVATIFRMTGDLEIAEDAYVDAAFAAFDTWADDGIPDHPGSWLTTHARRAAFVRCADAPLAGSAAWDAAAAALVTEADPVPPAVARADLRRLLVTCCDPALALDARVGLLLRLVSGLTTSEVARAFATDEATVAAQVADATADLRARGVGLGPAPPVAVPGLLAAVHLVFSTGNLATAGQGLARVDLTLEGIRLARLCCAVLPDEPEPLGLLALLLAVHARRSTRRDGAGEPVALRDVADADRTRWDAGEIAEATRRLGEAAALGPEGAYQLQARIAVLHSQAPTAAATDWPRIVDCYRRLDATGASPFVRVNRALAEAEVDGPHAGLAVLDTAVGVDGWHLYHAARADLLERAGRPAEAVTALVRALDCEPNAVDRRILAARLAGLRPR